MPLLIAGKEQKQAREMVEEMLKEVELGRPDGAQAHPTFRGQSQRVAVAWLLLTIR
jgi:ABC-type lipoprotein export system ATPase subunit